MGVVSSLGNQVNDFFAALLRGESGIKRQGEWEKYNGLKTLLGAPAHSYDPKIIPRQARRTMSRMSEMAVLAANQALGQADLNQISGPRTLICAGSTTGSPETFEQYFAKFFERGGPEGQLSTSFFKVMNHSVASNLAVGLGFNGPQLAVSSACATSTQAIVTGWELIQAGMYDIVICGGADELHHTSAAIFDNVHAASTKYNDRPLESPRPFDSARDGLVVSEGAAFLVLESDVHATRRGARKLATIEGGSYYCDGVHMSQPQVEGMIETMHSALLRAGVKPDQVDYVNAHGTGTILGDIQEAKATSEVFGSRTPVSSIKGHLGHSLAACGSMEVIACIEMMRHQTLIPTRNLESIDPNATCINLIQTKRNAKVKVAVSNNFAFGGMNATVVVTAGEDLASP